MTQLLDLAAMQQPMKPALFETGRVVYTAALDQWVSETLPPQLLLGSLWALILVNAHTRGVDWDKLPGGDGDLNWQSLEPGNEGRIMSVYKIGEETIWLITEWDRSTTTLLFPSDY